MKNTALFAAAVLCSPLALAQDATAPAATAVTMDAETAMSELVGILEEFATILEGINDKASADAAAEKLVVLGEKLKAMQAQAENLPQADEATQMRIMNTYLPRLMGALGRLETAAQKLSANNGYDSEALLNALNALNGI